MKYILLLFFSFYIYCDNYIILQKQFNPGVFNIGDDVILSIKLKIQDDIKVIKKETPQIQWGVIKNYEIQNISNNNDKMFNIVIHFIPYDIGLLTIPPIDLGDITIEKTDIFVNSVSDDSTEISNSFKPKMLPGTSLFISFVLLGIVLFFIIFIVLSRICFKLFKILYHKAKREFFKKNIYKKLTKLSKKKPSREIYNEISELIKYYINSILSKDYSFFTTQEIHEDLVKNSNNMFIPIINMLEKANSIRFSNIHIDDYDIAQDLRKLKKDMKDAYNVYKGFRK